MFNRDACLDLERSLRREWLETNGLGGYATSTSILCHNRKYHSLLCSAVPGLAGRYNLLSKIEFSLINDNREFHLSTNKYPGVFFPTGHKYLVEARFDSHPQWVYQVGDMLWRYEIVMIDGSPSTLMKWTYESGSRPMTLQLRPLLAFRGMHELTKANHDAQVHTHFHKPGWSFSLYSGFPHLFLTSSRKADFHPGPYWNRDLEYIKERSRGYPYQEDLFCPGILETKLKPGQSIFLCASLEAGQNKLQPLWDNEVNRRADQTDILEARSSCFIIQNPKGYRSILAGYPWFDEWGRDALIALPGLTSVVGRHDDAEAILDTYANGRVDGLIPNTLAFGKGESATNSVDASLWFSWALSHCRHWSDQPSRFDRFVSVLDELIACFRSQKGSVSVEENGLVWAGDRTTNLTWMDANVEGIPVTPRYGYAVELNALWIHTLWLRQQLSRRKSSAITRLLKQAQDSFAKLFWNAELGCLYDTLDESGADPAIRPNQLVATSLPSSPLSQTQCQSILKVVTHHLVTPFGLRTLSPQDPRYAASYEGDQTRRDRAYHQGTVWPWLSGIYVDSVLRNSIDKEAAKKRLSKQLSALWTDHLYDGGLGTISEVFSGDLPHMFEGCFAQAWSVAEVIRIRKMLSEEREP